MSLDWSIKACKVNNTKDITDAEWSVLEVIILECMIVKLNGITEKNAVEFYSRSCFHRKLYGHSLLSYLNIRKWIGLRTNVSTQSNSAFTKRVAKEFFLSRSREAAALLRDADLKRIGQCPDCGEVGEVKGHQTCQYPQ